MEILQSLELAALLGVAWKLSQQLAALLGAVHTLHGYLVERDLSASAQSQALAADTVKRVRVLKMGATSDSPVATLPPGHPDLLTYLETPGFYLQHPDGSLDMGRQ